MTYTPPELTEVGDFSADTLGGGASHVHDLYDYFWL
ncbi:lasso RiPP family leader peptide-containing protein [Saccharopolyspora sp. CA-218241]